MKKCYIVGAGELYELDFIPTTEDLVIAADGGYQALQQAKIRTDLLIGDFDSLSEQIKMKLSEDEIEHIRLPEEKDDTDMLAAVREGINRGYDFFYLYGGTGARLDHTLANLQILAFLAGEGKHGYLIDQDVCITAIAQESIRFPADRTGYVSVFAYTDIVTGVYERGLKYKLDNATLNNRFPVGTSNEFIGIESEITAGEGILLVTYPRED